MSILKTAHRTIRQIVFGDTLLPQVITLGFVEPQSEIAVWLHGLGEPIDVTQRLSMACAAPLSICIAFEENHALRKQDSGHLALRFSERGDRQLDLGEILLKRAGSISFDGSKLAIFHARSSKNYCLPRAQLWAHNLLRAYKNRQSTEASSIRMTPEGIQAMAVLSIRPYPVALASHDHAGGNIFPLNLMGDMGNGLFVFSLVNSRNAALGVERAGRLALSSVPVKESTYAFQLGSNHFRQSIEWHRLPFETKASTIFRIRVPAFAQRVRELEVVRSQALGSHRLFVARIISDHELKACENLHFIDGIYHSWRMKGRAAELNVSLAADSLNKRGVYTSRFAAVEGEHRS
jgi:hypothetical protein